MMYPSDNDTSQFCALSSRSEKVNGRTITEHYVSLGQGGAILKRWADTYRPMVDCTHYSYESHHQGIKENEIEYKRLLCNIVEELWRGKAFHCTTP